MNTLVKPIIAVFAVMLSITASAERPHIKNLRINPTPPGAKVSAAYLNLHNPGSEDLTLLGVSSPVISRVEIHKSEIVDDVAKMRKQDSVTLASDEHVAFKHGGLHIMLMGLDAPLFPGDKIPLVFHTDQGDLTVTATVAENIELPGDSNHEQMDHEQTDHGQTDSESSSHNH